MNSEFRISGHTLTRTCVDLIKKIPTPPPRSALANMLGINLVNLSYLDSCNTSMLMHLKLSIFSFKKQLKLPCESI